VGARADELPACSRWLAMISKLPSSSSAALSFRWPPAGDPVARGAALVLRANDR
jgi:hypothetical protein